MRSRRLIRIAGIELVVFMEDRIAQKLTAARDRFIGKKLPAEGSSPATEIDLDSLSEAGRELHDRVASIDWYHTIDLGHGVVTPGFFDHRPALERYHLPDSLAGKRVLDVATFDGFWALEFEKRGAKEVVAIDLSKVGDIDLAPSVRAQMSAEKLETRLGAGFRLAQDALGASAQRVELSVYDLSPERIGTFDFVFCGDLLIHLQNPVRALQSIRSVTDGIAQFVELCDLSMQRSGPYNLLNYMGAKSDHIWWNFGEGTMLQMIRDAGFAQVEEIGRFDLLPRGQPWSPPHVAYRASTARG